MKCFTEAELMEKLVEAFRRGVDNSHIAMDDQEVEAEPLDMIHEDAGGHDGWGKSHG